MRLLSIDASLHSHFGNECWKRVPATRCAGAQAGVKVWARRPSIRGLKDSEWELEELCRLITELETSAERFSPLASHTFAELKRAASGTEDPRRGVPLLGEVWVAELRELAESYQRDMELCR